jgi:general secretion pathway protein G
MTHTLGYFGPGPDGRRRGPSPWLVAGAVVAVSGFLLLAAASVPILRYRAEARVAFARSDVSLLTTEVDSFEVDTGRYPTAAEGLGALVSRPAGTPAWRGPYLPALKTDPWGRPYVYHPGGPAAGGAGCRVLSLGPDGKEGTSDDVVGTTDVAPFITVPATRPSATEPSCDGAPGQLICRTRWVITVPCRGVGVAGRRRGRWLR